MKDVKIPYKTIYNSQEGAKSRAFIKSVAKALATTEDTIDEVFTEVLFPVTKRGITLFKGSTLRQLTPTIQNRFGRELIDVTETKCRSTFNGHTSQTTLQTFLRLNPKGTFLVLFVPFSGVIIDGVLYADGVIAQRGKTRIVRCYEVKKHRKG